MHVPNASPQPCVFTFPNEPEVGINAMSDYLGDELDVYQVIDYNINNAYLWDPLLGNKITSYNIKDESSQHFLVKTMETEHSFGYIGFFKPDISETLAQIPRDVDYFTTKYLRPNGSMQKHIGRTFCFYRK